MQKYKIIAMDEKDVEPEMPTIGELPQCTPFSRKGAGHTTIYIRTDNGFVAATSEGMLYHYEIGCHGDERVKAILPGAIIKPV